MTGGGAGQQRSNRLNRLAIAPNNPADISLAELHPENRGLPRGNLREHHFIGKFDQLANDELEKFFHEPESMRTLGLVTPGESPERNPPVQSSPFDRRSAR